MTQTLADLRVQSSFRDPSGWVFVRNGTVYRQVNVAYREDYDHLISSGLYDALVGAGLLVPHAEVDLEERLDSQAYKILRPELIPFVSYPYEWCFSQLKDAALATLAIQRKALEHGMTLKDASAFNIQFLDSRPVLIDTLSFRKLTPGEPWVAYRQFCQHFLAPLALMGYRDVRLGQLLRVHLDGIPLDLAATLLPARTRLSIPMLMHIHLHSKYQRHVMSARPEGGSVRHVRMSAGSLRGLLDSLESAIAHVRWRVPKSVWADYSPEHHYTPGAYAEKQRLVAEFVQAVNPSVVWDLGANTGTFSRLVGSAGRVVIAVDSDPVCVEVNYQLARARKESFIIPLVLDLANPTPALGWALRERLSFADRGPADLVLALALVHHLAIANNVPLGQLARFLAGLCRALVIEFIPKRDVMVQRLLASREDVFDAYHQEAFEHAFAGYFSIQRAVEIPGSGRTLYLMEGRSDVSS